MPQFQLSCVCVCVFMCVYKASLVSQMVKNLPTMQEIQVQSLGQEDTLEWQPSSIFLPGEFHGQRSLAGYRVWGHKELDRIERLTLSFFKLTKTSI